MRPERAPGTQRSRNGREKRERPNRGSRKNQTSTIQRAPQPKTSNRRRPFSSRSIPARQTPLDPSRAAKVDIDARFVNIPESHRHKIVQTKTKDKAATPISTHNHRAAGKHCPLPPATTLGQSRAAELEIDARFGVGRRDLGALLGPRDFSVSPPNRELKRKTVRWNSGLE